MQLKCLAIGTVNPDIVNQYWQSTITLNRSKLKKRNQNQTKQIARNDANKIY